MARFPKTLGDMLAAQAESSRDTRTSVLETPGLAPIGMEQLQVDLAENITTLNDDLATLNTEVAGVDEKIQNAISDSNAIPLSDERFSEDSLSIWPFVQSTIPQGAFAPGAVGSGDLADFVITARKFRDDRHRLY